jgi:hypothetical protein
MSYQSPALRHQTRMLAAQAAGNAEPEGVTTGNAYELMLCKLADDRRRLKQIQSVKKKIEVKASLLPEYQDWIDAVLENGKGAQDDVVSTLLVWYIDTGSYARALQVAAYAIGHKFTLPDQYSRDIPTMLLDEFSGAYLNGNLIDDPAFAVEVLTAVGTLTEGKDAPDQARAKLHKALAYALIAVIDQTNETDIAPALQEQANAAIKHLRRALELFEGVGVKKDIERLERRIKRAADSK